MELTDRFGSLCDARMTRELVAGAVDGSGHRAIMSSVKNAVCCYLHARSGWYRRDELVRTALAWSGRLAAAQDEAGLFSSSGNVSSPPDSSFSLNDAAAVTLLLRDREAMPEVAAALQDILERATPALIGGGVHTPNQRWELSSALAQIEALRPNPAARERIETWLAEGVDIDADGLYSERSANYAAHVSNPSLLVLADLLPRPQLADLVHRNLHAYRDLIDHEGRVETVFSRRQDQKLLDQRLDEAGFGAAAFLMQFRRFGRQGCADCAGVADWLVQHELAGSSKGTDPTGALFELLSGAPEPVGEYASGLETRGRARGPDPAASDAVRWRVFAAAGVAVAHSDRSMITINAGSDVVAAGRVGSGLAGNPTFLRWRWRDTLLNSVRLSREVFGLGPFRADRLEHQGDGQFRLGELLSAAYYQPLSSERRCADGAYALEFDGRFSAQMAFGDRAKSDVPLISSMEIGVDPDSVRIEATLDGPTTAYCFEFGFGLGGTLSGATPIGDERWLIGTEPCVYRSGGSALTIDVSGGLGPAAAAGYHPGEAYEFLGGTDAVGGPRLYVPVLVPGRARILLSAS